MILNKTRKIRNYRKKSKKNKKNKKTRKYRLHKRGGRFDTEIPDSDELTEPSYKTWGETTRDIYDIDERQPIINALFYLIKIANLKRQLDFVDTELDSDERHMLQIYISPKYAVINECSRILDDCKKIFSPQYKPSKNLTTTIRNVAKHIPSILIIKFDLSLLVLM